MLKKAITYTNFDGERVTDTFHFHLGPDELAELEFSQKGGLRDYLQNLIEAEDNEALLRNFKWLITKSVGRRSEDGRRFVKSEEITADLVQTGAYSELFMELLTNADSAADFVKGILPGDLARKVETVELPEEKELTDEELLELSQDEFDKIAGTDPKHMSKRHLMIAFQRKSSGGPGRLDWAAS
jgi:hypothetical protein